MKTLVALLVAMVALVTLAHADPAKRYEGAICKEELLPGEKLGWQLQLVDEIQADDVEQVEYAYDQLNKLAHELCARDDMPVVLARLHVKADFNRFAREYHNTHSLTCAVAQAGCVNAFIEQKHAEWRREDKLARVKQQVRLPKGQQ